MKTKKIKKTKRTKKIKKTNIHDTQVYKLGFFLNNNEAYIEYVNLDFVINLSYESYDNL